MRKKGLHERRHSLFGPKKAADGDPLLSVRLKEIVAETWPWHLHGASNRHFGPLNSIELSPLFSGGEGEIRTHGTRKGSTVFETAAFDHSATSPSLLVTSKIAGWPPIHHPNTAAKINGATIDASDSITNFGVSILSFSHVIFSFGIAPE